MHKGYANVRIAGQTLPLIDKMKNLHQHSDLSAACNIQDILLVTAF